MLEGFETVGRVERDGRASRQWLLKRNCAMSPRQLFRFYLILVVVSSAIGLGFALSGAWVVLPFSGLDLLAVGVALYVYARHAADHERVVLGADGLLIEVVEAGNARATRMHPAWVRVLSEPSGRSPVVLSESGRRVVVGRHALCAERQRFAQELRSALARV